MQAQEDLTKVDKERAMLEHRAASSEQTAKDSAAQLRAFHGRVTALEAQVHAKDAELDEAAAGVQDARDGQLRMEQAHARLQTELRRASADAAQLTARLGVQTALCESKDVEIEELKGAVARGAAQGEATGEALVGTADEAKRLRGEVAQLQGSLKTMVWLCLFCTQSQMQVTSSDAALQDALAAAFSHLQCTHLSYHAAVCRHALHEAGSARFIDSPTSV